MKALCNLKLTAAILAVAAMAIGITAALVLRRPNSPPSLSIEVSGFTNRTGPFALLAITNTSPYTLTLSAQCLVNYSPTSGPRRRLSIDANVTATDRLPPNQGFVQEVFVFPSSQNVWQFEITAAYSSSTLELRRSTEDFLRKYFTSIRFPLTGRSYHRFTTDWLPAPP